MEHHGCRDRQTKLYYFSPTLFTLETCKTCQFWFISRILPQILSQSYLAMFLFIGLFPCVGIYLIRFSACSNKVSKPIQTTTLFIMYKILKMMLTQAEFKFLNYQLNDNGTLPPKKIIAKSKYILCGLVQVTLFSCKSY